MNRFRFACASYFIPFILAVKVPRITASTRQLTANTLRILVLHKRVLMAAAVVAAAVAVVVLGLTARVIISIQCVQ